MIRLPAPAHPALAFFLLCMLTAGCSVSPYEPLPRIEETLYQRSLPENPQNGSVLAWKGSKQSLRTFWGKQDIQARVKSFIPDSWDSPGEGIWRVHVQNGDAKPIPFLGVLRTSGKESTIVPPVNLKELSDGLYSLIIPGIERQRQEIVSIEPRLLICEIRDGRFQPFRVAIPLSPLNKSPLTKSPQAQEKEKMSSEGTPYPFSLPPPENQ